MPAILVYSSWNGFVCVFMARGDLSLLVEREENPSERVGLIKI